MNKQSFYSALYMILILSLICFMIFVAIYMKDERKDCLTDPVRYFEGKNENVSCYCIREGTIYDFAVKQIGEE